ncbi:hypothetical protein AVEN_214337-1 [Araneus ventricosus]|uniref:Uncharacterized protein n=1 Tax=Araneus ventricosus TaxID=182803 RepID=A0A4Y2HZG2_ARAVE|nr:hypothetical protein AVEN_214337-1 [Araneus ventricosus]
MGKFDVLLKKGSITCERLWEQEGTHADMSGAERAAAPEHGDDPAGEPDRDGVGAPAAGRRGRHRGRSRSLPSAAPRPPPAGGRRRTHQDREGSRTQGR